MPISIMRVGESYNLWAWQFFSIGFLSARLFSPWHKDVSGYGVGFDLERWSTIFLWNLISRFFGGILRICVILAGLVAEIIIIVITIFWFVFWLLMPLIVFYLLISGFADLKIT